MIFFDFSKKREMRSFLGCFNIVYCYNNKRARIQMPNVTETKTLFVGKNIQNFFMWKTSHWIASFYFKCVSKWSILVSVCSLLSVCPIEHKWQIRFHTLLFSVNYWNLVLLVMAAENSFMNEETSFPCIVSEE